MHQFWLDVTFWFSLVLVSSIISFRLGISAALIELVVGIVAGNFFDFPVTQWVNFLASMGAIVLTFLAGAELESEIVRKYWKEAILLGIVGFFAPFLGAWAISYYILGWGLKQSQLAGIALSTTSVAVVYAVMVETGLNEKPLGKLILAACFINDLGTVLFLGFLFTHIGLKFWIFVSIMLLLMLVLPPITKVYFNYVRNHPSEPEVKFIFLLLCAMGFIATKAGSEAVLPAYVIGAVLANIFAANRELVKRLRAAAIAILTPFYFIKAGYLVNMEHVWNGLGILGVLFFAKVLSKSIGLYPSGLLFRFSRKVNIYNVLLMSTGLTFGTYSALYGFRNGIIDQRQYSLIVMAVILSAIIPTFIAQRYFCPSKEEADMFIVSSVEEKDVQDVGGRI